MPRGFADTIMFIGAGEEVLSESPVWDSGGAGGNVISVTLNDHIFFSTLSWITRKVKPCSACNLCLRGAV